MKWFGAVLVLFLVGCATVNVYVTFPEEKIRKAAEDLLGPAEPAKPAGRTSRLSIDFARTAEAQESSYSRDMKTASPAIDEVKAKRESWRADLDGYKRKGYVGETNRFSVEIRTAPSDPKTAADVAELVRKENQQREIMIRELVRINSAPPEDAKRFQDIFSAVMRDRFAVAGDWIQAADGKWTRKK